VKLSRQGERVRLVASTGKKLRSALRRHTRVESGDFLNDCDWAAIPRRLSVQLQRRLCRYSR
jgi:hypothetical protein